MAVTTSTEYKTHANISGTAEDTRITHWLLVAQSLVEQTIDRELDSATFTEYYSGSGTGIIQLRNYPVTSITSVKPYSAASVAGSALASTTYKCDLATGELRLTPEAFGYWAYSDLHAPVGGDTDWTEFDGSTFDNEFRNVQVVYVAGYTAPNAPYSYKLAIWQVIDLLRATGGADPSMKSESIGAYSYTTSDQPGSSFQTQVKAICRNITRGHL